MPVTGCCQWGCASANARNTKPSKCGYKTACRLQFEFKSNGLRLGLFHKRAVQIGGHVSRGWLQRLPQVDTCRARLLKVQQLWQGGCRECEEPPGKSSRFSYQNYST